MISGQFASTSNTPIVIDFHIDAGMGKDTTVSVLSTISSNKGVVLSGPSNFTRAQSGDSVQSLTLSVQEVIQVTRTVVHREHYAWSLLLCINLSFDHLPKSKGEFNTRMALELN